MEIQKSHIRTINLKYQLQHGMKNLNNLIDHVLHQMFKIILNIYIYKKVRGKTVNPSIIKYINKVENRITFKIKTGYYLELLTPETMKLLGSIRSKITKDENGQNFHLLKCGLQIKFLILYRLKIQKIYFLLLIKV